MPLGGWIAERHGAPYWVVHRRDLQTALLERVRTIPRIAVETGFAIAEATDHGDHVTVRSSAGATVRGPVLVGADGIRSRIRTAVAPGTQLRFSGKAASRALLSPDAAASLGDAASMGVWLAPGAHVVHYPIAAGAQIAVVAIVPDDRMTDDWAAPNDWSALAPHLAGFAPKLRHVLASAPEWRRWALFETAPLANLAKGRIALAGDAAHPVFPFLAQGGVMALEDALVLASALAHEREDRQCPGQPARRSRRRAEGLRGRPPPPRQCDRCNFAAERPYLPPFRSGCVRAQSGDGHSARRAPHGPLRLGLWLAAAGLIEGD